MMYNVPVLNNNDSYSVILINIYSLGVSHMPCSVLDGKASVSQVDLRPFILSTIRME